MSDILEWFRFGNPFLDQLMKTNYIAYVSFVITVFFAMPLIFGFFFYRAFIRKTIKAYILKEFGDSFKIVGKRNLSTFTEKFSHKKNFYIIDLAYAILSMRNNPILYYKQGNADPIKLNPEKNIESDIAESVLKGGIFRKLYSESYDKTMFYLVIVLAVALLILALFSVYQITALQNGAGS